MKKMTNVEVNLINLNAQDILTTSGFDQPNNAMGFTGRTGGFVGARDYYDDEEEW